jgi:pimeloyl-ACP methyl ester carboxylesterase
MTGIQRTRFALVDFEQVTVGTSQLSVVAVTAGPPDGWPVVLLHGFPYDPSSYVTVTGELVIAGARVVTPERIHGLVAVGGYEIQDIAGSAVPALPLEESRSWYQYYFHSERGRAGLARYRRELTAQLWQEWAPGRPFPAADFDRAAPSFDNPDFVDVVIHSYRHRFALAPGDPAYDEIERRLVDHRLVSSGHDMPHDNPDAVVRAVLDLHE